MVRCITGWNSATSQNLSVVRPVLLVLKPPHLPVLQVLHHVVEPGGLPVLEVVKHIEPCVLPTVLDVDQLVRLLLRQRTRRCFSSLSATLLVSANMFVQMVRSGESFAALRTDETLLTSVCSQMALQLVRPSERLAAENPPAGERPLPCMPPQVGLQVTGLAVHLATARHVANMLTLSHLPVTFHTVRRPVLAVWTLASPAPSGRHALRVFEQGGCYLSRVACSRRCRSRGRGVGSRILGGVGRMRPHVTRILRGWWVGCWILGGRGSVGWPPGRSSRVLWVLANSHHGGGGRG